jgi:hypothetical protein
MHPRATLPAADRLDALRGAWARASASFVVDGRPAPRTADQVADEARAWLATVFEGADVPFALPPDLVWWIEEVACVGWSDDPARPEAGPMDMLAFLSRLAPEAPDGDA